jgi:hypothetical protein
MTESKSVALPLGYIPGPWYMVCIEGGIYAFFVSDVCPEKPEGMIVNSARLWYANHISGYTYSIRRGKL